VCEREIGCVCVCVMCVLDGAATDGFAERERVCVREREWVGMCV